MAVDKPLSTIDNPNLPNIARKDNYRAEPLLVAIVFLAFVVYVTYRTFENQFFIAGPLLSPLYSPMILTKWTLFGKHISPAIFILPVPLLFRTTCYYYRKAYYRAFFMDPHACGVKEPFARKDYTGERAFPLILQNIHRYAFYLAAIVMVVLWWDAIWSFTYNSFNYSSAAFIDPPGWPTAMAGRQFGVSVGSLVFLVNVIFLILYTFSCHSWRHLTGGCVNCFSKARARHTIWQRISHLNEDHMLWAWCSLFSVALADLYVRCVAAGVIHDIPLYISGAAG
jgi:hypothetical protein